MARTKVDPSHVKEIAARLIALRESHGYTQRFIGQLAGVSGNAWQNWEGGAKRIGIDAAILLCQRMGVTLDWIYLGNIHGLRVDTLQKLEARTGGRSKNLA